MTHRRRRFADPDPGPDSGIVPAGRIRLLRPLLLAGGAFALIWLLFNRKTVQAGVSTVTSTITNLYDRARAALAEGFNFARAQAFQLALPSRVARWAPQILAAAQRHGVSPWFIAGVIERESLGGDALKPTAGDPGGTGDFIPRQPSSAPPRAGWQASSYASFANPATGLPPDGLGWGRGLMQIDYGAHNAWVKANNWRDPGVNIDKGTQILKENLAFFQRPAGGPISISDWRWTTGMPTYKILPWSQKYPAVPKRSVAPDPRPLRGAPLYEAAIAAFNAGTTGVLQAVAAGVPAEGATSGQDYVTWFLSRIGAWAAKF